MTLDIFILTFFSSWFLSLIPEGWRPAVFFERDPGLRQDGAWHMEAEIIQQTLTQKGSKLLKQRGKAVT